MACDAGNTESERMGERPTLLKGPGKSADASDVPSVLGKIVEPDIPKLRFSVVGDEGARLSASSTARSESLSSSAADGEFPPEYRPSECLRLKEVAQHYKMGRQIGEGGYGKVYKVTCKKTGRHFALKEVTIPEDKDINDIETEVATSSEFDHPYILMLHAFFREGRTYHLVSDLCTGGNLGEFVLNYVQACRQFMPSWNSGLPGKSVKKLVPQMMSGMLYLHHHGFVHRDIKPHNYLLVQANSSSDTLKLCDFGMCVRIAPEEKLDKTCGTRGYIAPEVIWSSYDQKADVFSLGMTIFAISNDLVPPGANDETAYAESVQSTLLESRTWQQENVELSDLVLAMLQFSPVKRPTVKELMSTHRWAADALSKKEKIACQCSVM